MYLLYADGSGDTKIKRDRAHGLYVLSGAIVHESRLRAVENDIIELKRSVLPHLDPRDWELHAHELWNNSGFFKADMGLDFSKKTEIFERVANTIRRSDVTLLTVAVFKDRIRSKRSASKLTENVWTFVAERFEHFLKRVPGGADMGMIFMDSSDKISESEIRNTIEKMTRDTSRQRIEHVMQETAFVRSDVHLTIQLADMAAYIVNRHYKGDSRFDGWFETIMAKAYSPSGRVRNYGIKEFPSLGSGDSSAQMRRGCPPTTAPFRD